MKSNVLFTKFFQMFILLIAFGLFTVSCSKENDVILTEEDPEISTRGSFDFFNTYGSDFEGLFSEEVWLLMNTDPERAMQTLTGETIRLPFGKNVAWIPYIAVNQADYALEPIYNGNDLIGVRAISSGEGVWFSDQLGQHDITEEIDQTNLFTGDIGGTTELSSDQVVNPFEISSDIVGGAGDPKGDPGFLDGATFNKSHSGILSDALGGFAVRKANGPVESMSGGTVETVTLGYLAFIN